MSGLSQPDDELDTWQEIAAYLGISVREAQYREKNDGMPVHRMLGRKPRVKAYRTEVDAWKARVASVRSSPGLVSECETEPRAVVDGRPVTGRGPETPRSHVSRRFLVSGIAGFAGACGLGAALLSGHHAVVPMRAEVVGNALCTWDEAGREMWKYRFSEPLREREPLSDRGMVRLPGRGVQIVDALGGGGKQVLFAASFLQGTDQPPRDELCCFSSAGKLLWRYKPDLSVTFGDARFSGPWLLSDLAVFPRATGKTIWLAISHWMWRPGAVLALDNEGRAEVKFVNAGQIYALGRTSIDGRNYIIAGGVNNEYAAAALAVFDENAGPSRSPQTQGSRFECLDTPKGWPDRYLIIPPSELTMASDQPYNMVVRIKRADDQFLVDATDIPGEYIGGIYRFSNRVEPLDVAVGDGWAARHRRLQQEGRLDHGIRDCPLLRHPTQMRLWKLRSGWTTLAVPPSGSVKPDGYQA